MSDELFSSMNVMDEDIAWAEHILGLPQNAFDESRKQVLKSMGSIDVPACPGSGKTTLVVAKLAILARKWPYKTRGICVLSHTNVARHEIETRLGNTNEGKVLLGYPHFVGTIDSFVDNYLAIPWLRSQHRLVLLVDTDLCLESRWRSLNHKTRYFLKNVKHCEDSVLILHNLDYRFENLKCSETSPSYQDVQQVCKKSITRGNFCYEEMYLWANEFLSHHSYFSSSIHERFPFLIIDEAQDNNNTQTKILDELFLEDDHASIRQRFGDPDQAVFTFNSATSDIKMSCWTEDKERREKNSGVATKSPLCRHDSTDTPPLPCHEI